MSTAETTTISQRMKDECWDLHQSAETATLPKLLLSGQISREQYVAMLEQLYCVHKALDDAITAHRPSLPAMADLIDDVQLMAPRIAQDLAHFGGTAEGVTAGPAASATIDLIAARAAANPLSLIGLHYVREGANNGNIFIARKLQEAWKLDAIDGLSHLAPYGDQQRAMWGQFKTTLDGLDISAEDRDEIVTAGREMFQAIIDVNAEVASIAD
ncbi:MAG: biliverdin-producing heme oxygenase [Planctomycetota bacterium]